MRRRVIIMRGIPGSGKSHHAAAISSRAKQFGKPVTVVSADDFFVEDGEYLFDPRRIGQAHADCMRRFLIALKSGVEVVIVDNTNIHLWEYDHYMQAADLACYGVEIMEAKADVTTCIARNIHGVPAEVIGRMACEYEEHFSEF